MASFSMSGASRKPPSVTMPATPRTISRDTRIDPADAALASFRLSITSTAPGGHSSIALRWGWDQFWNTVIGLRSSRAGMVGIGLAHHPPRARIDRVHILNELVAQAALEQAGREGCDADGRKFFASLLVQAGHGLISPFVLERAPMKHFRAPAAAENRV